MRLELAAFLAASALGTVLSDPPAFGNRIGERISVKTLEIPVTLDTYRFRRRSSGCRASVSENRGIAVSDDYRTGGQIIVFSF